jgi:hypothetical protein
VNTSFRPFQAVQGQKISYIFFLLQCNFFMNLSEQTLPQQATGESRVWSSRGWENAKASTATGVARKYWDPLNSFPRPTEDVREGERERCGHSEAFDPYDCDQSSHRVNSDLATSLCSTYLGFWKRENRGGGSESREWRPLFFPILLTLARFWVNAKGLRTSLGVTTVAWFRELVAWK